MADRPQSLSARVWERLSDPQRCETLAALSATGAHRDEDFARLIRIAASVAHAESSSIAVVDAEHAWLVSAIGTDLRRIPVEHSLAAHVVAEEGPSMLVADAASDPRFSTSVVVTGPPFIRWYAGVPIEVHGQRIGALQVFGPEPQPEAGFDYLPLFQDLAATAGALFELKHEARVRAQTAAELIKEEWRHALTLEAGKVGSWVWDVPSGEIVANDIARRMFGLSSHGPIHIDQVMAAVEPADRPIMDAALKSTFEEGVDYAAEFRVASGRWLFGRGRVYQRDAQDRPLVMMGVNIDVTEARRAADHTRLLLRELNHRVKNTLAMVQSLARQTLRHAPEPQRFIDAFAGRLRTLSDAHSLLSDRDWSGIGLMELIDTQVRPYVVGETPQLRINGEDVQLPPDHALGMGMILHELASNAAQFGALSTPSGEVAIGWSVSGSPPRLDLSWIERGGPKVEEPQRPGLGARLIERGLDKVIESQVELKFAPSGVEARIRLPLA